MGLPPTVFLIAKYFFVKRGCLEQFLRWLCYLFGDKAWVVCMYVIYIIQATVPCFARVLFGDKSWVVTYHSRLIPEGIVKASHISREAHVLSKWLSYKEYCRHDRCMLIHTYHSRLILEGVAVGGVVEVFQIFHPSHHHHHHQPINVLLGHRPSLWITHKENGP
jgi:hypothetical protein